MANVTFKHESVGTIEIDTAELSPASVDFLLQYGIRQYLADGAAVAKVDSDGNDRTSNEISMLKQEGIHKRLANIESGVFPAGGGNRDPLETEINRVARAAFAKAVKATGKKLPDDKEARKVLLKSFTSKNYAAFEGIAQQNLANLADLGSVEI